MASVTVRLPHDAGAARTQEGGHAAGAGRRGQAPVPGARLRQGHRGGDRGGGRHGGLDPVRALPGGQGGADPRRRRGARTVADRGGAGAPADKSVLRRAAGLPRHARPLRGRPGDPARRRPRHHHAGAAGLRPSHVDEQRGGAGRGDRGGDRPRRRLCRFGCSLATCWRSRTWPAPRRTPRRRWTSRSSTSSAAGRASDMAPVIVVGRGRPA